MTSLFIRYDKLRFSSRRLVSGNPTTKYLKYFYSFNVSAVPNLNYSSNIDMINILSNLFEKNPKCMRPLIH